MSNHEEYVVNWEINETAESFREAAILARSEQLPGTEALCFQVTKQSTQETRFVDLTEEMDDEESGSIVIPEMSESAYKQGVISLLSAMGKSIDANDDAFLLKALSEVSQTYAISRPSLPEPIQLSKAMTDEALMQLYGKYYDIESAQYYDSNNRAKQCWLCKIGSSFVQLHKSKYIHKTYGEAIESAKECYDFVTLETQRRNLLSATSVTKEVNREH